VWIDGQRKLDSGSLPSAIIIGLAQVCLLRGQKTPEMLPRDGLLKKYSKAGANRPAAKDERPMIHSGSTGLSMAAGGFLPARARHRRTRTETSSESLRIERPASFDA